MYCHTTNMAIIISFYYEDADYYATNELRQDMDTARAGCQNRFLMRSPPNFSSSNTTLYIQDSPKQKKTCNNLVDEDLLVKHPPHL